MSESKRIVITGVSRGLGRAMTELLVEQGHAVLGCGRSQDAVAELASRYPAPCGFEAVDVSDDAVVGDWARRVLAGGAPDLLLNNAAVINEGACLWDVPAAEFERLVDINIKGMFYVLRHFVPAMIERGSGVIVNFSSGWGRSTSPEVGPYCASKWAVEGMTRALAQELPAGLAAIPLNPGVIDTDMLQTCFGASASSYQSPQDWARTAVPFLLQLTAADNGEPLTAP